MFTYWPNNIYVTVYGIVLHDGFNPIEFLKHHAFYICELLKPSANSKWSLPSDSTRKSHYSTNSNRHSAGVPLGASGRAASRRFSIDIFSMSCRILSAASSCQEVVHSSTIRAALWHLPLYTAPWQQPPFYASVWLRFRGRAWNCRSWAGKTAGGSDRM